MDSRPRATTAERVYEDVEPSMEWARETAADTLLIYLHGFRKEHLKVQVTSSRILRISRERQLTDNRWCRFRKEIPISSNYDPNEITAKFEKGILYVRQPKIIVPAAKPQEKEKSTVEASQPQQPTQEKAQPQPSVQIPKPDQKPRQETIQAPQDAPKPQKPVVQEKLQPPTEAPKPERPSQEKEKLLRGASKSEKASIEPQAEGSDLKIGMDKQKSAKIIDEIANIADNVSLKTPRADKEQSKYEWKEMNNELPDAGKAIVTARTSVKLHNLGNSVHDTAKMDKDKGAAGIEGGIDKFSVGNYMQVFSGIVKELKKPRKLINLVLVILSFVVLGLYVMNSIRSHTEFEN